VIVVAWAPDRHFDFGFGIWDLGFGIWDLGFGIWDLGLQR
jgi:hypothetical protein